MNIEERRAIEGRTLLLFDGLCGLCHGTIRFLIRRDLSKRLLYAPLESSFGREMLERSGMQLISSSSKKDTRHQNADGIVLIEAALTPGQFVTTRSDATIRVLRLLNGSWPLAGRLLAAIPRWLREAAYGWIAKWRYRMFGVYKTCPLPSLGERGLILGAGD